MTPTRSQIEETLHWLDHQPHAEALDAARRLRAVLSAPTAQVDAAVVVDDTVEITVIMERKAGLEFARRHLGETVALVPMEDGN